MIHRRKAKSLLACLLANRDALNVAVASVKLRAGVTIKVEDAKSVDDTDESVLAQLKMNAAILISSSG